MWHCLAVVMLPRQCVTHRLRKQWVTVALLLLLVCIEDLLGSPVGLLYGTSTVLFFVSFDVNDVQNFIATSVIA